MDCIRPQAQVRLYAPAVSLKGEDVMEGNEYDRTIWKLQQPASRL